MTNQEKLYAASLVMTKEAAREEMNPVIAAALGSIPLLGSGAAGMYAGAKNDSAAAGLDHGAANALGGTLGAVGGAILGTAGSVVGRKGGLRTAAKGGMGGLGGLVGGGMFGGALASGSRAHSNNVELENSRGVLEKLLHKILGK